MKAIVCLFADVMIGLIAVVAVILCLLLACVFRAVKGYWPC